MTTELETNANPIDVVPPKVFTAEDPYLKNEFNTYVMWKVMPRYFKYPPPKKVGRTFETQTTSEFLETHGIDDDMIMELAEIKTQKDFAQKYGVAETTLVIWNRTIEKRNILDDVKKWAQRISKNVVLAMYNNSLSGKNLNADRDRLNFLKFAGYVEKSGVQHSADETLTDMIKRSLLVKPKQDNGSGQSGPTIAPTH